MLDYDPTEFDHIYPYDPANEDEWDDEFDDEFDNEWEEDDD